MDIFSLIKQRCPDGVPCKKLSEVVDILEGVQFNEIDVQKDGLYPVMNGDIFPSDYIDKYNQNANTVIVSQSGSSAGYVNWMAIPFWASIHCYVLKSFAIFNKYLYYILKTNEYILQSCHQNSGIQSLSKSVLLNLSIPVPPFDVQQEIVSILDKYDIYCNNIISDLVVRLSICKQQFEYYRNKLLTFDDTVERKFLGEVVNISDNLHKPILKSDKISGLYPYYGSNGIQNYVPKYLLDGTYLLVSKDSNVISNDVYPFVIWVTGKFCFNNHVYVVSEKQGLSLRYLFYYLQSVSVSKFVKNDIFKLTLSDLKSIVIPVPSGDVQQNVIGILDKFQELEKRLEKEIEVHNQQYEYYRDKLLDFPEKN